LREVPSDRTLAAMERPASLRQRFSLKAYKSWTRFRAEPHAPAPVRAFTEARTRTDRIAGTLRVLSLNLAHGRADGSHQLLQSARHRELTLSRIAALFERERPDIVGLQEADGPSFWSGGFCHVEALARRSGFAFAAHGTHVEGPGVRYGTGLLSQLELADAMACTFDRSLPTPAKGFTVATARVDDTLIDVVSVHLDFLRAHVRARQVARMVEVLAPRRRPLVVMGDFNAGWRGERSAVQRLATSLQLVAHAPHARVHTFPAYGSRLDWILVSPQLAFERHEVLPDIVSDHLPVVADIRLLDR
jgi:endonuclease/exonuclease/phosphatase family metal-dependent hydrolase